MSNDNTLDDLILTDPEPEKAKSKGLLALLALVILLIIVGAILAKMVFSDSDKSVKGNEDNKVEVATDVNKNINDSVNSSSANADLAPINNDPDLAPIDNTNSMPSNVDTVSINENNKNGNDQFEKANNSPVGDSTKIAKDENSLGVAPVAKGNSNNDAPMNVVVEERPTKPKHTTKKREDKKPKPKHTTKAKKHSNTIGGRGTVYIQVGSFTKGPADSFIKKIRRAGFKYRIKSQNGYRRVFVGPFESRQEASRYLGKVRGQINPQAFIK